MGKKLQRVFRDRRLTAAESAGDKSAREAVAQEFPPRGATRAGQPGALSDLLKQSIRDSGLALEMVAHAAGLPTALVAGFMSGERDIHLTTADKLAQALSLEVTTD